MVPNSEVKHRKEAALQELPIDRTKEHSQGEVRIRTAQPACYSNSSIAGEKGKVGFHQQEMHHDQLKKNWAKEIKEDENLRKNRDEHDN